VVDGPAGLPGPVRVVQRDRYPAPATPAPTPAGPLDKATVDEYAELGVDRLVLLPQPDATPAGRHAFVPVDRILRNIDTVAHQILGS
jgi:hypothetical protein